MAIRPLYDRVVVRPLSAETTSQGGVIIPDSAAEKPSQGEVLAVGEGAIGSDGQLRPLTVKVGDTVLFTQYAGTEFTHEGEKVLVMKESDILAVIDRPVESKQEKAA